MKMIALAMALLMAPVPAMAQVLTDWIVKPVPPDACELIGKLDETMLSYIEAKDRTGMVGLINGSWQFNDGDTVPAEFSWDDGKTWQPTTLITGRSDLGRWAVATLIQGGVIDGLRGGRGFRIRIASLGMDRKIELPADALAQHAECIRQF